MESQKTVKKSWVKRHPILTGLGALIIIFIVVGSSGNKNSSTTQSASSTSSRETEQPVAAIKVKSEALRKAYAANQVSADQMYEGKLVEISGTVDTIGKDLTDEAYVTFEPADEYAFDKVQCMFRETEEASIAGFAKGQSIVVQGTVSGVVIAGPLVRNCKVVSS